MYLFTYQMRDECLFIAHVLLLLTYVLTCLPCNVPLFTYVLGCLMWLPLVGYACFVLARHFVVPLYRDAYRVANQWVCSYKFEF